MNDKTTKPDMGSAIESVAPRATEIYEPTSTGPARVEYVEYREPGRLEPLAFRLDPTTQSFWATQAQMALLFGAAQSTISYHLKRVFDEGELTHEGNIEKLDIARSTKPVSLYSLDAVISVGYRVNSAAATRFRQWSTQTLKAYIQQGYVLNDQALRADPAKLDALAAAVRALRSEEMQIYAKVRECFKISASDYDPSSRHVRAFYALLQDKFLHAVTKQTASKLVLDRCDHRSENLGVQNFSGRTPTLAEAKVGKNYLFREELYRLHLLSEQFLLYAEATALSGRKMTMKSLRDQLDKLLTLNEYPVLEGYTDFLRVEAETHAKKELELYRKRQLIEAQGVAYDEDALAAGEFDELLLAAE